MKNTSTPELLLLHAYGETNSQQKEQIARQLAQNPQLNEELTEIVNVKKALNTKMKSPSETSIRIIMEYSNKTEHLQEI